MDKVIKLLTDIGFQYRIDGYKNYYYRFVYLSKLYNIYISKEQINIHIYNKYNTLEYY